MNDVPLLERLSLHPLFLRLSSSARALLIQQSKRTQYRSNRPLLREGESPDWVFCLLHGAVRVFHRNEQGDEVVVKLFRAPVIFGEMEVLSERPYLEYVTTLERCDVLQIPAPLFRRFIDSETNFCRTLVRDLSQRLCIATCNERMLAFYDVETRLAGILLDYAALGSTPESGGALRVTTPLSQDQLAHDLGVSRRSVTRAMNNLRALGELAKKQGRLVLPNPQKLRARLPPTLSLTYRLG